MVKRLLSAFILFATTAANAQKVPPGQKLQTVTSSKITMAVESLGQNIQLENTVTAEVEARTVSDTGFVFLNTTKKLWSKTSGMGQNIELDSEKPEDLQGEAGSVMKKAMNSPKQFHVNKAGKITAIVNDIPGTEPSVTDAFNMVGLMGEGQPFPLLLFVPGGRTAKQGDSWTDSSSTGETMKTVNSYTIRTVSATDYIVGVNSVLTLNIPIKQQGMEIKMNMAGTMKGDCVYEKSTGLLRTSTALGDIKGTMNVMGQTVPMNMVSTHSLDVKKL